MNALPKQITIGDKYGPAMNITDEKETAEYFEKCVEHMMQFGHSRAESEAIERENLGYYAGYYNSETMQRVNRLYLTRHPIFGDAHAGKGTDGGGK